jgi:hypothetical protein
VDQETTTHGRPGTVGTIRVALDLELAVGQPDQRGCTSFDQV